MTAAHFANLDQNQSLESALAGLRPAFLSFRGRTPTVYVDGVRVPSATSLRDLPIRWVERVQLLDAIEAGHRYGASQSGTALLVTTCRGR